MRPRLFLLAALLLHAANLSAGPWPQFRGPNGAGEATGKDIPSEFSAKKGILWKLKVPGKGNSSPVVWGKHLFLQTASEDGRERFLVCVDVAKGELLWQRSIPGEKSHTHPKNTLASATPATDGERVYAAFWDGENVTLWAYTFKGEPAWNLPLGPFNSEHGAGASPMVYKDRVYFANDMDKRSTLYCIDKKDGSVVWKKDRPAFRACYSPPLILAAKDKPAELVITSSMGITGYDPDKGEQLWDWKWDWSTVKKKDYPLRTICGTIYMDGMLFACSGDGGGDRLMHGLTIHGDGKATKLESVWTNKKDFPYVPCLLEHAGHIFFINDAGLAGCFEGKSGKRLWFERAGGDKVAFSASPVLIDDRIFAVSEAGDVYVWAADPKGFKLLGTSSIGELTRTTPAVADGRLYLRGAQHLYCIGK